MRRLFRAKLILILALSALWISSAYALPISPPPPPPPPPGDVCVENAVVRFGATPSEVGPGGTATLSWSVQPPPTCKIWRFAKPLLVAGEAEPLVGTKSVQPVDEFTAYTLQWPRQWGVATLGITTVAVTPPRTVVDIKNNTLEMQDLLIRSLAKRNTTIRLWPNVDMDLSYDKDGNALKFIPIAGGVSLVGGQPCEVTLSRVTSSPTDAPPGTQRAPQAAQSLSILGQLPILSPPVAGFDGSSLCGGRTAQYPGPRLYTHKRPDALFIIGCEANHPERGDNVHLSGFRLQGPHWDSAEGGDNLERGIMIRSCLGVDISNMEVSGWSGAAIYVIDDLHRQTGPDAVKVHDNFIHHNQHIGGDGYGVDASNGGWALIERNVFDFNRHAITAGHIDKFRGGYRADRNLVLKGGGWHGKFLHDYTQQFDVHGDDHCFAGKDAYNCGNSGDRYDVTNNAVQYTNGPAFRLRGTPKDGAYIFNNVFAAWNQDSAITTHGNWGVHGLHVGSGEFANRYGMDSFGYYGVCDFDGSGRDGLFQATGASWWYMGSGKQHWTYLNSYPDTLDQIALGDFEGHGRCDVFAVHGDEWVISSGGTAPWRSLGHIGIPFDQLRFGHFTDPHKMEIFRRAPDGQWSTMSVTSTGVSAPTALWHSPKPLTELRFGRFNPGGITDVIALENGQWSMSRGGRTAWEPLNPGRSDSLAYVFIADIFGTGVDDIVRYDTACDNDFNCVGTWWASRGGRGQWERFATVSKGYSVNTYLGHFEGHIAAQLLTLDLSDEGRYSKIFNPATDSFVSYSKYSY